MEKACPSAELRAAIEGIKSAEVVENRVEMILELGNLEIVDRSDVAFLVETLTAINYGDEDRNVTNLTGRNAHENLAAFGGEDFTCLDVTQCFLNRAIIQLAAKYLKSHLSCLSQLFNLGNQAAEWCAKHLKMTAMSLEESQETEHCDTFFQLLLDVLAFSAASFTVLTQNLNKEDNIPMTLVEAFISEQLDLIRELILVIKKTPSFCLEALKAAQLVIDLVIKFCGEYSKSRQWNQSERRPKNDKNYMDTEPSVDTLHMVSINKCAIRKLCEIGVLIADCGGSLASILNVSWRGVVTLLQLGKGSLELEVAITDIVITLISLANELMKCAALEWSLSLEECVSLTEARKTFVPVKFYLVNAMKISSLYPVQAYQVFKEVARCAVLISNLRILFAKEDRLKIACEVSTELLDQTCINLLCSLLNSNDLEQEMKFKVLNFLFSTEYLSESAEVNVDGNYCADIIHELFSVNCESMSGTRLLLNGRVLLFISFLKFFAGVGEDVRLEMARMLEWIFDILIDEEVYSCIMSVQMPQFSGTKKAQQATWETLLTSLVRSLEIFSIVASTDTAWTVLESFLVENFFHPNFLCQEIILDVWCFLVRHADSNVVNGIIDELYSCLKFAACSESIFVANSALRIVARSLSILVSSGKRSVADRVCSSVLSEDNGQLQDIMFLALLREGFSLSLLSDKLRIVAVQKVLNDYDRFLERYNEKLVNDGGSSFPGIPVLAMSACLPSLLVAESNVNEKTLKVLINVLQTYDPAVVSKYLPIISSMLAIVSNTEHLYASAEIENVVLALQNLFVSRPAAETGPELRRCLADLPPFMAGLGYVEIDEREECRKTAAIWELYHMLLKERHWAFMHLAISSFGDFAARTSCNKLWKFVPLNAALSYDLSDRIESKEDRFMSELKAFLEKEAAFPAVTSCSEQYRMLRREGLLLKAAIQNRQCCERREVDPERCSKRRKVLDEINKGVELLHSGMKVISACLSQGQKTEALPLELHDRFLAHYSSLKDAIAHLAGIAHPE